MRVMRQYGDPVFPDLPKEVDDNILSQEWSQKIHSQTLERLNERGGMSVIELIMNLRKMRLQDLINKYGYNYKTQQKDVDELLQLIKEKTELCANTPL